MERLPIHRKRVEQLLFSIEESLQSLTRFRGMTYEEFDRQSDFYRIAFFDLHRILEAMMDLGAHLLSRIPGARPERYKDIARLLGEQGIVPQDFARGPLLKMAGYRNRMVHFYSEISKRELWEIIQSHLSDCESFSSMIKGILRDPSRFGFRVEE